MPKNKKTNGKTEIKEMTASDIDVKIIEKFELKKEHSYLLLFKTGTMPYEQAQNLAHLLADAGFKALFVAVQDTDGIKIVERQNEKGEKPVRPATN